MEGGGEGWVEEHMSRFSSDFGRKPNPTPIALREGFLEIRQQARDRLILHFYCQSSWVEDHIT